MNQQVCDNPELLALLMRDAANAPGVWRPKARWHDYAVRIADEIERSGLKDFRTNYRLLKGFSEGGIPSPNLPRHSVKKAIWRAVSGLPVVATILSEERRLVAAEHRARIETEIVRAQLVLAELERGGQMFRPLEGLANGGAEDAFEWREHVMTPIWVDHLTRATDIYRTIPTQNVETIVEVGSGLAQSTLAHLAVNRHLKWIVNIDIPPVLYIAGQYLRSIPCVDLVDYAATHDFDRVIPEAAADGRTRVYMLPPWQTTRLDTEGDLFLNAASFQEMDRETCAAYAREITRMARRWVIMHCGRGGDQEPLDTNAIAAEFVLDLFRKNFADHQIYSGSWQTYYQRTSYVTHVFARDRGGDE